MGTRDPRVDAYIAKSADFARPILERLRDVVHGACPDVAEEIKWGHPSFAWKGMLCGMAAFKAHCAFGFWKHRLVVGKDDARATSAMGDFGRLTSVSMLPSRTALTRLVRKAMDLNERGVKAPRDKTAPKKPLRTPRELAARLAEAPSAQATFDAFSPSHRREYIEWIAQAKRPETKQRRLDTTIQWLSEGKTHNWRYEKRC